jgi:hypothetical protein
MGEKISSNVEKILARAYLTGMSRADAAVKAGGSTSSVSNYWASFREIIGPEGEAVRDLSIKVNQINLSVEQMSLMTTLLGVRES